MPKVPPASIRSSPPSTAPAAPAAPPKATVVADPRPFGGGIVARDSFQGPPKSPAERAKAEVQKLKDFQKANGLEPTGVIDGPTGKLLDAKIQKTADALRAKAHQHPSKPTVKTHLSQGGVRD